MTKHMSHFDRVFQAIKKHCNKQNTTTCLANIRQTLVSIGAQESGGFYLDFLSDLGLIQYDGEQISLTDRGRHTDTIFE